MSSSNLRWNSRFSYGAGPISATANIQPTPGILHGVFVSAASSTPTITIYDSATTTTSTTIISVFTPVAGTYYPLGDLFFKNGCYVVISGTVSATFSTATGTN
jgi:hypothetical protein